MTRIHFAGINTRPLAEVAEGFPILMSYADVLRGPGWWRDHMRPRLERRAYPSVMLDSGAFTVISRGISIDVDTYAAWAAEHAELFDRVVNLDDIAGDCATSRANLRTLERHGVDALPVFHQGEPWAELHAMQADRERVGLGFARKPGGRLAHPQRVNGVWLRDAFRELGDTRAHGFAMTRWALGGFPFETVDSTTWIQEGNALMRRNPGADAPRPHGLGGALALHFDHFDRRACHALALRSYDPAHAQAWPALRERVDHDATGQARTVLARLVA